jgi:ATP-dependent RNA helicase MSS116
MLLLLFDNQFGLPDSRETYIHRLGRTGRAGKSGQGLLVLAPFETRFLSELKGLDVPENSQVAELLRGPVDKQVMESIRGVLARVKNGDSALTKSAEQAYRAFLGYYVGQMRRISINSKAEVVDVANYYSTLMGLNEIPGLEARTVGKMGLKGVAGVRITKTVQKQGGGNPRGAPRGRRTN